MGIGLQVATELFNKHRGTWEVCYLRNNVPASKFWQKVIEQYTNNNYEICGTNDKEMIGFKFHC